MSVRALREAREGEPSSRTLRFGSALLRDIGALGAAAAVALGAVLAVYQPVVSGLTVVEQQAVIHRMIGMYGRAPGLAERLASISPFSKGLAHLGAGIASVARQNAIGGGATFLNGSISTQGFPSYFFQAFAMKTGLPFIASVAVAVVMTLRRRFDRRDALIWVPVLYYFVFSIGSSYNIGIRHVLPVYPLLAIAACRSVERRGDGDLERKTRPAAFAAVLSLFAAQGATALAAHPFELSYFNVFRRGTAGGYRHLAGFEHGLGSGSPAARRGAIAEARVGRHPLLLRRRPGLLARAGDSRFRGGSAGSRRSRGDLDDPVGPWGRRYYAVNGRMDLARALARLIRTLRERGELV
jgi:hypothetical protein